VTALEEAVAGLQNRVVELETEKSGRELQMASLQGEITRLEDANKTDRSIKDGQAKAISKLEGQVKANTGQVGQHQKKQSSMDLELSRVSLGSMVSRNRVTELEKWDTITAEWIIENFGLVMLERRNLRSTNVPVAGREMCLSLEWTKGGDVGLFINHSGGFTWTPISIGNSSITIKGSDSVEAKMSSFAQNTKIEKCYGSLGWAEFLGAGKVDSYIVGGKLTVVGKIRVARIQQYAKLNVTTNTSSSASCPLTPWL
jgi:hypothetical protein